MALRKTSKPETIDAVQVCTLAFKQVKCAADYNRIGTANTPETLTAAWNLLTELEQQRITDIVNNNAQPDPQALADELIACGSALELKRVKSEYGDAVKEAWKLLPQSERDRIKTLCDNGQRQSTEETPQPVIEQPTSYQVEAPPQPVEPTQPTQPTKRSLYAISTDLYQAADELEAKLDTTDDPEEQATLIDLWLQASSGVQAEMLERVNAYLWVLRKQKQLAEYRMGEGKRLRELAEQSENLAKRLEEQLLNFMDAHSLGKLETKDFKVSPRHASSEPLVVDEAYPLNQVPEEFVVVSRAVNRKLAKEAIKAGQQLPFATLGTKTRYLYIR